MVKHRRDFNKKPIFDETLLNSFLKENGYKLIHGKTIWRYLIKNPMIKDFYDIPGLPISLYPLLCENFNISTSKIEQKKMSMDKTIKLLLKLQDGHDIETVIMKHEGRNTLCVSSQIGCQMGCTFCATGTMGIIGNLLSGEIVEQLFYANQIIPIRNIVFMGMGEPLENYNAVLEAIHFMTREFNIAPKHITLSTVGIIHRIKQLKKDAPLVRLALSLHAPTQELRNKIVPSSRSFPINKLMAAIDEHLQDRNNRLVMIEYVMINDINDSIETAHDLGILLEKRSVHINLIPYNSTDVDSCYSCPSKEKIYQFLSILREKYNLKVTIRENHGGDIDGACGQLALKNKNSENNNNKKNELDIEDYGMTHTMKEKISKLNTIYSKKNEFIIKLFPNSHYIRSMIEKKYFLITTATVLCISIMLKQKKFI